MSSILKALQKLESESGKVDREKSWLTGADPGEAYAEGPKKVWTSGWRIALLGLLIIFAGSAGVVFSSKLFKHGTPKTPRVSQQLIPTITAKDLQAPQFVPEKLPAKTTNNSQAKEAVSSFNQGSVVKKPHHQGRLAEKFIRTREPQKPKLPEKTMLVRKTGKADPDGPNIKPHGSLGSRFEEENATANNNLREVGKNKKALKPIPNTPELGTGKPDRIGTEKVVVSPGDEAIVRNIVPAKEKEPPSPVENPEILSLKVIEGLEINLQAISWAPGAERRIAVINNSIVKEGDRVSGFLVFKINRDDVILSQGGELWKLNFSHR
ncbi:MAG: hypothetical protein JRE27_03405 [Deltaproteobacteria bacterium]|nr:hypothetical protein [Deltaproteobacteria bacterium]